MIDNYNLQFRLLGNSDMHGMRIMALASGDGVSCGASEGVPWGRAPPRFLIST